MQTINKLQRCVVCAGVLAACALAQSALAQTFPKEGNYDFTSCYSGTAAAIAFSKTQMGFSYEMTGTARSNPPGGMMDNTSFRCVGMNTSLDGKANQLTMCEALDRDGDKQLAYLTMGSDGKVTREVVAGTGKYEGIQASGVVLPLGNFPQVKPGTMQNCNRQTGTYKLK
ncbi:MAG: hypothetical protein WCK83_00840 [Burkholderiales bacterium]|nr:hypothetical protein [Burkholderiales bacterium]